MRKPMPGPAWTTALLAAASVGTVALPTSAGAAPMPPARQGKAARLSIASPATGNLVAGLVQVAVAFDAGSAGRITVIELWVDDLLYSSQTLDSTELRGTHTLDWDTLQVRNGQHSLKVRAYSGRKLIANDSVVVSVSNGGVDVVPPLISFYSPLDGQIVSGDVSIGVNASDNDQLALVGIFVNRQLKLMKSNPPFQYTLDTTTLPLLNGRGALVLEAWAYDRAQNRGVAKPVTVYVQNRINATPMQPDPKASKAAAGESKEHPPTATDGTRGVPSAPSEPVVTKPEPVTVARLSPLEALLAPSLTPSGAPSKSPGAVPPPAPQPAPAKTEKTKGTLAAPEHRVDVPLAPQPSPDGPRTTTPPASRPSRSEGAVAPRHTEARLDVSLKAAPAAHPMAAKPRTTTPARSPAPRAAKPSLKPAPVALSPLEMTRLPESGLVAVPRASAPVSTPSRQRSKSGSASTAKPAPSAAAASPRLLPKPAATKPADGTIATARPVGPEAAVAKPASPKSSVVTVVPAPKPPVTKRSDGLQQGSTPDRIVLPVYRLARLPRTPATTHTYTVQRGDTLGKIARQHGVTTRSILVANGLNGGADLVVGRRLSIPGTIMIAYNDQPVGFDVQPRVEGGMAITPFRQLFEHTGGVVRYQPTGHEVQATNPEKEVRLKIGSREALVNSAVVLMDRAAFLDSGRTMVPVKFMTEALDLKAEYDLKTGAIYLIHK